MNVVWVEADAEGKTVMGLKYINISRDQIRGIPRFEMPQEEDD